MTCSKEVSCSAGRRRTRFTCTSCFFNFLSLQSKRIKFEQTNSGFYGSTFSQLQHISSLLVWIATTANIHQLPIFILKYTARCICKMIKTCHWFYSCTNPALFLGTLRFLRHMLHRKQCMICYGEGTLGTQFRL